MTSDLRRRARLFRIGRIAVLAIVIAYFLLPYGVRSWFPVWLLFLLALGLELDFFLGGWLQTRQRAPADALDRGPQQRDLSELGTWGYWDPRSPRLRSSPSRRSGGSTSSRPWPRSRSSARCSTRP